MGAEQYKKTWLDAALHIYFSRKLDSYDSSFDAAIDRNKLHEVIMKNYGQLSISDFCDEVGTYLNVKLPIAIGFGEDFSVGSMAQLEPQNDNVELPNCEDADNTSNITSAFASTGISSEEFIANINKMYNSARPINVQTFDHLVTGLIAQYERKNTAYGNSFDLSVQRYGKIAALTRMSDKWNRLENLMLNSTIDSADESVTDTLLDLATYAVMTVMALNDEKTLQRIEDKLKGLGDTAN